MAPPISTRVGNLQKVLQQFDLVGDLGAAHDGHVGPRGVFHRFAQVFELFLHQQSRRAGGKVVSDALRGGVGAMRGTKRVVHVNLGERGQLLRKLRHVLFFLGMEAQVFEQQHVAVLERLAPRLRLPDRCNRPRRPRACRATCARRVAAGFRLILGLTLPLGRPRCEARISRPPRSRMYLNGGQRGLDARVIGDFAGVVQGHIEIHAHENALAFRSRSRTESFGMVFTPNECSRFMEEAEGGKRKAEGCNQPMKAGNVPDFPSSCRSSFPVLRI